MIMVFYVLYALNKTLTIESIIKLKHQRLFMLIFLQILGYCINFRTCYTILCWMFWDVFYLKDPAHHCIFHGRLLTCYFVHEIGQFQTKKLTNRIASPCFFRYLT